MLKQFKFKDGTSIFCSFEHLLGIVFYPTLFPGANFWSAPALYTVLNGKTFFLTMIKMSFDRDCIGYETLPMKTLYHISRRRGLKLQMGMKKRDLARALCYFAGPTPYSVLQSRCMYEGWELPCNTSGQKMRKYVPVLPKPVAVTVDKAKTPTAPVKQSLPTFPKVGLQTSDKVIINMIKESKFLLVPVPKSPCILVKAKHVPTSEKPPLLSGNGFYVFAVDDGQKIDWPVPWIYVKSSCSSYINIGDVNVRRKNQVYENTYKKHLLRYNPPSDNISVTTVVMFGSPCSGKSTVIREKFSDLVGKPYEEFVHVDPDEARLFSDDFQYCLSGAAYADSLNKTPNTVWYNADLGIPPRAGYGENDKYCAAGNAFIRSVDQVRNFVQKTTFDFITSQKYNVVYDSTCAASASFCMKLLPTDSRIYLGVFAPIETIVKRCAPRGEKEGRFVPEAILRSDHANIYGKDKFNLYNKFKYNLLPGQKIYMYDNSSGPLKLIAP